MSIEICQKCAKHVDTDYDTESIVYQGPKELEPRCLECAELQCYWYSVKTIDGAYARQAGWIDGLTIEDATEKLKERYGVPNENIDIKHNGTWAKLMQDFERYGCD